jgi:thiamine-phosphate pyrophosphorylase
MATSKQPLPHSPPPPRLYLATPVLAEVEAVAAQLPALIKEFDIAAVLLRLADADERTLISRIKTVAPAVQTSDAALLVDQHYGLVARGGADGANVDGIDAMREAEPSLKPARILGVGGLSTRHDAMLVGESSADYLLFGEPDAHNKRPSPDAIFERLQWWAEVFEPPCVGYAATLEEVALFASTGADFIMVADFVWTDPDGPRAALKKAQEAITLNRAGASASASMGEG